MNAMPTPPSVAIALQGGGSHAAFGAGVLLTLLQPEHRARYRLVALTGTSGGAMCAALAWSGLIERDPEVAARRLLAFWRDVAVNDAFDAALNFWSVWLTRLPATAEIGPYLYRPVAEPLLRELLTRHLPLDFLPPDADQRANPKLLVGATDIVSGLGVIFEGETLTYDDLIASASIPPFFPAVHAHGTVLWDGLFSTNPPVRELTDLPERPDEIWVVQINPQRRAREPLAWPEIVDRRNELSGNLALAHELHFVAKINELLSEHPSLATRYKPIGIRVVEHGLDLDYPSKLDRNGTLIQELIEVGSERGTWFFDSRSVWPGSGASLPAALSRPLRAAR